jgi:hypothetical protein
MAFQYHHTMENEEVIMVPISSAAKEEYTNVELLHTMESEQGNINMFPIIPAAKVEYYADVETQREKVNNHDAGSLQPQENHDRMTLSHVVRSVEQNFEGGNEASGKLIDTPVQNIDEASCAPADSEAGCWSSEDGMSVIDESHFPKENDISEKETKDVSRLKLLVILILAVSASTIAACVYRYISRSENSQFESKFVYDASKIFQSVGSSLDRTLAALDSLAVTMVSYARDENNTWPFVTLPDFGVKMSKLLPLTDAFVITVISIVHPEKRKEWEEYSLLQQGWVNESMGIQETWEGYYGPIIYDWKPYATIHGDDGDIEKNVR